MKENTEAIYLELLSVNGRIIAIHGRVNAALGTPYPDPELFREVWHECAELQKALLELQASPEVVADIHFEGQFVGVEVALDLSRDLIDDSERRRVHRLARDCPRWN